MLLQVFFIQGGWCATCREEAKPGKIYYFYISIILFLYFFKFWKTLITHSTTVKYAIILQSSVVYQDPVGKETFWPGWILSGSELIAPDPDPGKDP
jgi:hypothetical protein